MPVAGDVVERVAAAGLVGPDDAVLVLLSGGADSTCLLDCLVRLAGEVSALHVHYGLRPEADADADACLALSGRLGTSLEVLHARRPDEGGGNVQAWAREVRYRHGSRRAEASGALLAAGHTATDQVETVLYRLAASPGRRALLGMQPRSGRLVRPLLGAGISRAEAAAHCVARGLPVVEDATNAGDHYARSRVRHGLLEAMRDVDARAEANVLRTAELLREEAEVLDEVVDTALAGRDELALGVLGALPRALARLVLRRLAEDRTGRLCPRAGGRLEDVLALGASGALDLGDGARALVRRGVLRVELTPPLGRSDE